MQLADADRRVFDMADVGELSEPGLIQSDAFERTHLSGCRTEQMIVVRAIS